MPKTVYFVSLYSEWQVTPQRALLVNSFSRGRVSGSSPSRSTTAPPTSQWSLEMDLGCLFPQPQIRPCLQQGFKKHKAKRRPFEHLAQVLVSTASITAHIKGIIIKHIFCKTWQASVLKTSLTSKILDSYEIHRNTATYKQHLKTTAVTVYPKCIKSEIHKKNEEAPLQIKRLREFPWKNKLWNGSHQCPRLWIQKRNILNWRD